MVYSNEIYNLALKELKNQNLASKKKAEITHQKFISSCPEALIIEQKLRQISLKTVRSILSSQDKENSISTLSQSSLELQKRYDELLSDFGYTKSDISVNFVCEKCQDTGYVGGYMCSCLKELLKKISFEELNKSIPLEMGGFENYSLKYFDTFPEEVKAKMQSNFFFCREYADNFSEHSKSLLFYGATGLGKTHLSLAIAKVAIQKGFGVIYGSIQNFVEKIEKERFADEHITSASLQSCDLLIIDDLGVEFSSSYTQSVVYDVINTRIMTNKTTIINTNLEPSDLQKKYGERMISRFLGSYKRLQFAGKDIRRIKSLE